LFGGVVHNPLHMAGKIIGSFHDANGKIQIPGFYDAVQPLSGSEKMLVDDLFDRQITDRLKQAGVSKFWAESLGSYGDRATALPTLDVNGMWGGYQGEGTKTVIPSEAGFKVTMRLVANQNPHEIGKLFEQYVQSFATDTVAIETRVMATGWPTLLTFEGPIAEAMNRAFIETCDKSIQWIRSGGSIPIGGMFQNALGVPITGLGLGTGDNFHAPNEYIRLDHFQIAIDTLIHYLYNLSDALAGT
jgi:acetylornithine deacetylase/succinyl-diaminopimelate desuccinylase-like protein